MYDHLTYLKVEGDRVAGSYGSSVSRADLIDIKCRYSPSWNKQISSLGIALTCVGVLMLYTIQETAPAERATWPLYKFLGGWTILAVLGQVLLGVYLIMRRRSLNKRIPEHIVYLSNNGSDVPLLVTNDAKWAAEASSRLSSLQQPDSGNLEFFALEKRISEIH